MKAIAITASPRKNGNTDVLTRHVLKALEEEGFDTQLVRLCDLKIEPCNACMVCEKEERCPIKDDMWPIYTRMKEADAIILASPVYFGSATPEMKAFMDRAGFVAYWHRTLERKVGGPISVAERNGTNFTIAQMAFWFLILGCFVPGSSDWPGAFGSKQGEVEKDEMGLKAAWDFAKNVAFLVKKLKS
jgi:multimeric flavodoxin WrbA